MFTAILFLLGNCVACPIVVGYIMGRLEIGDGDDRVIIPIVSVLVGYAALVALLGVFAGRIGDRHRRGALARAEERARLARAEAAELRASLAEVERCLALKGGGR